MLWILYYNIRAYIRQKHHIWWAIFVVFLCLIAYIFSTLTIADQYKTFREMYLVMWEFSLLILSIYYVVSTTQWSQRRSIWHVMSTQGASHRALLLSSRLLWLLYTGYTVTLMMMWGILLSLMLGFTLISWLWLLAIYLVIKIWTIYTFAYIISFFARWPFVVIATTVVYMWMYTAWSIQILLQNSHYTTASSIIQYFRFLTPEFASLSLNPVHMQRLSTNIFSIVLYCGIYILLLVTMLVLLYPSIRWK